MWAIYDVAPDVRESAGRESDGLGVGDWLSLVSYELFVVVVDVQIGEVETCGIWSLIFKNDQTGGGR